MRNQLFEIVEKNIQKIYFAQSPKKLSGCINLQLKVAVNQFLAFSDLPLNLEGKELMKKEDAMEILKVILTPGFRKSLLKYVD